MTETESTTATPTPDALASVLADAPFVRLVAADDGDSVAAAGTLAGALRKRGVPFQVRVSRDPVPDAPDDEVAVTVGGRGGARATESASATHGIGGTKRPASATAFAVARELGGDPDPVTVLAGSVAAGSVPGADGTSDALDAAELAGQVTRRPGVAIPTADLADGLSASTLLRAPYSGDPEAARAAVAALDLPAALDDDAHRRLASLVAVDTAAAEGASDRAPAAIECALRPYAIEDGKTPFETVGGYADVLGALAREAPGTGVALTLASNPSDGLVTAARDAWREHGLAAHRALADATTGRYDGCVVARVDATTGTLPTVARLLREFRSPEPIAIALDESSGAIAAAATESVGLGDVCRSVAAELGGDGWGTETRGGLEPIGDPTDALAALREAL